MFGDLTKRVLMVYKADTASAQADIKKLSLTQKEHASALKKDLDAQNVGLESQIGKYASYAAKAAVAYAAIKVGLDSMEFYYERNELREKAQGHSIDALREATRGLVSETELLKMAQAANHGVMKASSDELVTIAQAMDVYAERGHNAVEVQAAFNEYLQTGKSRVLKDYGLQIDEARGSTEQFKQVMSQLTTVARDQAFIVSDARDAWDAQKVSAQDTIASIREKFGALVEKLQPAIIAIMDAIQMSIDGWGMIIDLVKDAVGWIGDAADATYDWVRGGMEYLGIVDKIDTGVSGLAGSIGLVNDAIAIGVAREKLKLSVLEQQQAIQIAMSIGSMSPEKMKAAFMEVEAFRKAYKRGEVIELDNVDATGGGRGGGGRSRAPERDPVAEADAAEFERELDEMEAKQKVWSEWKADFIRDLNVKGTAAAADALTSSANADIKEIKMTAQETADAYQQFNAGRTQSVFREMFGDPEEINLYASGFNMLKDASVAAFQAVITGSEGAGAAFKKVLASQMMSLASSMFGKSIYYAAEAIGYTVSGSWGQAAAAAKAAGAYAAGAIALGVVSKSLGAGSAAGGGTTGNASVGPSTRSAAVAQGDGAGSGRNISIIVGDDFADDSPRKRQQKAERLVKMGLRSSREVVFA